MTGKTTSGAHMSDQSQPQIYLITPPEFDLETFPSQLDKVLADHDIACVRVALSTRDENRIIKSTDAIREVCHKHDVAVVIDAHVLMVERLGLDGVHFNDNGRSVRKARKDLGDDAIIGSFCGTSRHDGMNAAESGADYVAFGPISGASLGDGTLATHDLFEWWSEMIEVPVVAEGGLTADLVRDLSPVTDFFAFGDELWKTQDPSATLATLIAAMA
jgi:thiamine-phosphate pyrophosphorylase